MKRGNRDVTGRMYVTMKRHPCLYKSKIWTFCQERSIGTLKCVMKDNDKRVMNLKIRSGYWVI